MGNKDKRITRIWKDIDEILWNDWDSIGVKVFEKTARDEYQDYIYGVFRLIAWKRARKKVGLEQVPRA